MVNARHQKCARRTVRLEEDGTKRKGRPSCIHDDQARYGAAVFARSHMT